MSTNAPWEMQLAPHPHLAAAAAAFLSHAERWALPAALIAAAPLVWLARQGQCPAGPDLTTPAARLAQAAQRLDQPDRLGAPTLTPTGRRLRDLILAAYAAPEPPLLLMLLHRAELNAAHAASRSDTRHHLARQAEAIFVPLAELFGIWELRDELAELAMQILRPDPWRSWQRDLQRHAAQRAADSARVLQLIAPGCDDAHLKVDFRHVERTPANAYRRDRSGEERDRILGTVKLDVLAADRPALDGFCEISRSILSRHQIACNWHEVARFNGFHAFSTTLTIHGPGQRPILIRMRAFTPAMEAVNQRGFVAMRYQHAPAPPDPPWWDRPAPPLNGDGPTIPVLSRVGEVFQLPAGATALDFAYTARSDLVDHCTRVWVNGDSAAPAQRLRPGDLVEIEIDRRFRGPAPSWESAVELPEHRLRIRRALAQCASAADQGRQLARRAVHTACATHALEPPDEREFQLLIERAARRFNYVSTEALCVSLVAPGYHDRHPALTAAKLAARFVEQRFAALIADQAGAPIVDRYPRLKVARPATPAAPAITPGAPIVGRLLNRGTPHERLLVLPAPDAPPTAPGLLPLTWLPAHLRETTYRISIETRDRWHLLGDILHEIYTIGRNGATLHRVQADTDQEPYARIDLLVTPVDLLQLERLRERIVHLAGDDQPRTITIEPARHPRGAPRRNDSIPYTTNPVTHPQLFVGRDAELNQLIGAISNGLSLVVIAGPSRIGKTSLLRWLADRELIQRGALPIPVAIGGYGFSIDGFWNAVLDGTRESLKLHQPIVGQLPQRILRPAERDRFSAVRTALAALAQAIAPRRPVLLIDEFTALYDHWERQAAGRLAHQLLQLLQAIPALGVILVVHDTLYTAPDLPAGLTALLQKGSLVQLSHLPDAAAAALVLAPAGHVEYDPPVVRELVRLTDAHPYLLQYLLMTLHERAARQAVRRISLIDLRPTLNEVLHSGQHIFRHMRNRIPADHAPLACAVARIEADDEPCTPTAIRQRLRRMGYPLPNTARDHQIATLCRLGLLVRADTGPAPQVRYRIPLFAQWMALFANPHLV